MKKLKFLLLGLFTPVLCGLSFCSANLAQFKTLYQLSDYNVVINPNSETVAKLKFLDGTNRELTFNINQEYNYITYISGVSLTTSNQNFCDNNSGNCLSFDPGLGFIYGDTVQNFIPFTVNKNIAVYNPAWNIGYLHNNIFNSAYCSRLTSSLSDPCLLLQGQTYYLYLYNRYQFQSYWNPFKILNGFDFFISFSSDCSSVESQLNQCQSDLASCQNDGSHCDTLYGKCVEDYSGCQSDLSSLENYNESLTDQLNECLNNSNSSGDAASGNCLTNSLFWFDNDNMLSLPITNNLFLPMGYQGYVNSGNVLGISDIDDNTVVYEFDQESKENTINSMSIIMLFLVATGFIMFVIKFLKKLFFKS